MARISFRRLFTRLSQGLSNHLVPAKSNTRTLIIICSVTFFTAFGVRLLYLQDMRAEKLYGGTFSTNLVYTYEYEAARIANQGGLLFPNLPVERGDARMIIHPPGYSFLLAAIYRGNPPDRSYAAVRLTQIVCDSAAAVLIVLIAAELFLTPVAFISGLLAAFSPHLGYYSVWLTPDSLVVVPILFAVYLLIKAGRQPRLITIISAGIMLAVACWLRSNSLLLAPFLVLLNLVLFKPIKRAVYYSAVLILTTGIVIVPLTIRNWVVYGRFIPLSLGAGVTMLEGVAEYDKEGRFNLPMYDGDVALKEAEDHGRPDYSSDLWNPDGVERERLRLGQALTAIRSDVPWFLGVMLQRMAFMTRYNDFDQQHRPYNTTTAPAVAEMPPFGHSIDSPDNLKPIWSVSPSDAAASGTLTSQEAKLVLLEEGSLLELQGDGSRSREQFAFAPFALKRNTDYLLNVPTLVKNGRINVRIRNADGRITLGQVTLRAAPIKQKRKTGLLSQTPGSIAEAPAIIQIPFTSGNEERAYLTIKNDGDEFESPMVQVGQVELSEIGATPYLWTKYPRAITRGIQKNLFTTTRMRLFVLIGVLLLAIARFWQALVVLLAIPAYYLIVQSVLHTEFRYILGMHYFLFIIGAVTLYCLVMTIRIAVNRALGKPRITP